MFSVLSVLFLSFSNAFAQEGSGEGIDISYFRPPPDGMRYFGVPSASTFRHYQLGVSVWATYENDPLVLINGYTRDAPAAVVVDGEMGDAVVDHRFMGNIQLSLGLAQHFSISVDLPLVFWQSGYQLYSLTDPLATPDYLIPSGMGDIRFYNKVVVLDRDKMPVGFALALPVSIPSGAGYSFFGEGGVSLEPTAIFELSDGSVRNREYSIRGSVYAAYRIRPQEQLLSITVGNELLYGAGFALHPVSFVEFVAEYRGSSSSYGTSSEIAGGIKFLAGRSVEVNLAGGAGAIPGMGTADYRGIFGVTVAPVFDPAYHDPDGDGLLGRFDDCPEQAEDFDGFEDADGCPDPDNDGDGIFDQQDGCPNKAEDVDGFQDKDGCPDPDNDGDGVLDIIDRCPNKPETVNKYLDEDGCPDFRPSGDADGDRIKDDRDQCPFKPEDFDGFEDDDGCPEEDNDGDGIPDFRDQCADAREVYNGVDDTDGCPDESDRVRIVANKIEISQKIYFDFAKATIKPRSDELLDEISSIILAHPELSMIQIEGHTDDVGGPDYNQTLSEDRANAVRDALIKREVDPSILTAIGKGEDFPLVQGSSDKAREKNRRVEFIILKRK